MAAARTTTPKVRTLIVERAGKGRLKITIPATAKVTYAAVNPQRGYGGPDGGHVLRIYEGTKQTAVFHNVVEFRDVAYPIQVEQVEISDRSEATVVDGKRKRGLDAYSRNGAFVDVEDF